MWKCASIQMERDAVTKALDDEIGVVSLYVSTMFVVRFASHYSTQAKTDFRRNMLSSVYFVSIFTIRGPFFKILVSELVRDFDLRFFRYRATVIFKLLHKPRYLEFDYKRPPE